MAGTPVKLTFDLDYPDHARAYEVLKAQKHTTQFVVNLILGAGAVPMDAAPPKAPTTKSNRRVTAELPASNPRDTQVTEVSDKTTLADIPAELLEFL